MKGKATRSTWKKLKPDDEMVIVNAYNSGVKRSKLIIKYKIPENQLYNIIRKTLRSQLSL